MSFWKRLFGRGKQEAECTDDPAYDVEGMTEALLRWEEQHFPETAKSRKKPELRYQIYYSDSGRRVSLKSVRLENEEPPAVQAPGILRELIPLLSSVTGAPLPAVICREREALSAVLASYQEQRQRLASMQPDFRQDPFFQTIRQVIYMKLKIMYNELCFLQSDRLTNEYYAEQCLAAFRRQLYDLRVTNARMGDYMLSLSRMEYEDVTQQLEEIRCGAAAMLEVVNQQVTM